jgi:hypothetical protein
MLKILDSLYLADAAPKTETSPSSDVDAVFARYKQVFSGALIPSDPALRAVVQDLFRYADLDDDALDALLRARIDLYHFNANSTDQEAQKRLVDIYGVEIKRLRAEVRKLPPGDLELVKELQARSSNRPLFAIDVVDIETKETVKQRTALNFASDPDGRPAYRTVLERHPIPDFTEATPPPPSPPPAVEEAGSKSPLAAAADGISPHSRGGSVEPPPLPKPAERESISSTYKFSKDPQMTTARVPRRKTAHAPTPETLRALNTLRPAHLLLSSEGQTKEANACVLHAFANLDQQFADHFDRAIENNWYLKVIDSLPQAE